MYRHLPSPPPPPPLLPIQAIPPHTHTHFPCACACLAPQLVLSQYLEVLSEANDEIEDDVDVVMFSGYGQLSPIGSSLWHVGTPWGGPQSGPARYREVEVRES